MSFLSSPRAFKIPDKAFFKIDGASVELTLRIRALNSELDVPFLC